MNFKTVEQGEVEAAWWTPAARQPSTLEALGIEWVKVTPRQDVKPAAKLAPSGAGKSKIRRLWRRKEHGCNE